MISPRNHSFTRTQLGGKSERPSSPPHPALGFGCVFADEAQRASDFPVISNQVLSHNDAGGGE